MKQGEPKSTNFLFEKQFIAPFANLDKLLCGQVRLAKDSQANGAFLFLREEVNKMAEKIYKVKITETLSKVIEIQDADNEKQARSTAIGLYIQNKVVFNKESDLQGLNIEIL